MNTTKDDEHVSRKPSTVLASAVDAAAERLRSGRCPCCGVHAVTFAWESALGTVAVPARFDSGIVICGWCSATNPDAERVAARTLRLASRWESYAGYGLTEVMEFRLTGALCPERWQRHLAVVGSGPGE